MCISLPVVNLGFYCFTGFSQNSKKPFREIMGRRNLNLYSVKELQRKF